MRFWREGYFGLFRHVGQPRFDETERETIAAELWKTQYTIHDNITAFYRRLGVSNRARLIAFWLGCTA